MNMKNVNKITKYFITLFWLGLSCSILEADSSCGDGVCNSDESYDTCPEDCKIAITELFIKQAEGSHTPQYIELYNNSDSPINLEGWSITTRDDEGKIILPQNQPFNSVEIDAFGYFLISSSSCDYSTSGCNFYNDNQSDVTSPFLKLPFDHPSWNYIDKGSIVLRNDTNNVIDSVGYNIETGWPVGDESIGRSLRLHSPELDNSDHNNWSLSPETEKSIWLYDEGEEIKSFGSPREENSFRLFDIQYSDSWFPDTSYANGGIHAIYGDVNDFYRAEPYEDFGADKSPNTGDEGEGNGIWDFNEEYHDRNMNNIWDHQDNNYDFPLTFSWYGTSSSWFSNDELISSNYEIIIEKKVTSINTIDTIRISNNTNTTIFISPIDLLIDELGSYREIAEYTWTVELTKTFSDTIDIIYSDEYTFSIDASDYGRYGCVDNGSCADDGSCPTNAYYESSYISNHPTECIPENDISAGGCYSAINFDENANINSNTCHYVSLSIPAFVFGDANTLARVPVYMYNDSLANIDSIAYTLSFDNSSNILSYEDGTFSGTVISDLNNGNIEYDDDNPDSISVYAAISEFSGAGIITYLDFELIGSPSDSDTTLTISLAQVQGGFPENNIMVPVVGGGEVVILQTNYVIAGQVYYYLSPDGGEPLEVPNVVLSLSQKYNGDNVPVPDTSITTAVSSFRFEGLTVGNYNLSFSKSPELDCIDNGVNGWDLTPIEDHLKGIPLDADKSIAADVSLDGTVSGYDISLIAQYSVDLIDNFNDIETHWIFKPTTGEQPQYQLIVHSELLEHNGTYSIEYKPLVLDDDERKISAYRLGDVNASYCRPSSTSNRGQVQFTDIAIDYTPIITLSIIISEPTFIEGMDIEIGYDEGIFNPLSITFNNSNKVVENYQTVSNLLSKDRTIKTVTWAIEEPQIVEGRIGEVSFNWNNKNKSGKIWLKKFQINDEPAVGGISVIGLSGNDVVDGVNIINSLVPVELSLHQNYPNPFNPQTTIKWSMPLSGMVSLGVYNLQGQLVELLINGQLEAGSHEQIWDATAYSSGIYFYRMTTNKKTLQKVMLLLK